MSVPSKRILIMGAVLTALLTPGKALASITVTAIDVGQGDAVLVEHGGYRVMIDAGQWSDAADHLDAAGIDSLDLAIATHAHADHIGGFRDVFDQVEVDKILYNGQVHTTQTFEQFLDAVLSSDADYLEPARGDQWQFGDMRVSILHPAGSASEYDGHLHDKNIVTRIDYGEFSAIITGDIELPGEQAMIDAGVPLDANVVELGHHGSSTSSGQAFLDAVDPDFAFYQAGEDNRYGHPHDEVISRLQSLDIEFAGTANAGTIRITGEQDGSFSVETEHAIDDRETQVADCVDLNTSAKADLKTLPHIGPSRAQAIKDGRPWDGVHALREIHGLGPARVSEIKQEATVCE